MPVLTRIAMRCTGDHEADSADLAQQAISDAWADSDRVGGSRTEGYSNRVLLSKDGEACKRILRELGRSVRSWRLEPLWRPFSPGDL